MQTSPLTLTSRRIQIVRPPQPRLRSEELFQGTQELIIEHQGQEYRLRLTRNDKLILNK